jgi:hypothetical protein
MALQPAGVSAAISIQASWWPGSDSVIIIDNSNQNDDTNNKVDTN